MQNLGRYLQKTFKDQTFLPTSTLFDSTESEIKLQIPTDTPGYKVMTYMGNQVIKFASLFLIFAMGLLLYRYKEEEWIMHWSIENRLNQTSSPTLLVLWSPSVNRILIQTAHLIVELMSVVFVHCLILSSMCHLHQLQKYLLKDQYHMKVCVFVFSIEQISFLHCCCHRWRMWRRTK